MRQKGLLYVAFSSTLRVYEQSNTLQSVFKTHKPSSKKVYHSTNSVKVDKEAFFEEGYEF